MRAKQRHLIDRWLTAEASGRTEEAEDALTALFAELPSAGPSTAFVGAVLARAGVGPAAVARHGWWWRLAALAALLLVPSTAVVVLRTAGLGGLAQGFADGVAALGRWLAEGSWLWAGLSTVADAVGRAAAVPAVAAGVGLGLFLAAVALRLLYELLASERSWSYADTV